VDPLGVAGCRGKRINARLIDCQPVTDDDFPSEIRAKFFEKMFRFIDHLY
jgi:hypothetical protein